MFSSSSLLQFLLINNYSKPIIKLLPSDYYKQEFLVDIITSFPFMISLGVWVAWLNQMEWLVILWSFNYSFQPFNSSAPPTSTKYWISYPMTLSSFPFLIEPILIQSSQTWNLSLEFISPHNDCTSVSNNISVWNLIKIILESNALRDLIGNQ